MNSFKIRDWISSVFWQSLWHTHWTRSVKSVQFEVCSIISPLFIVTVLRFVAQLLVCAVKCLTVKTLQCSRDLHKDKNIERKEIVFQDTIYTSVIPHKFKTSLEWSEWHCCLTNLAQQNWNINYIKYSYFHWVNKSLSIFYCSKQD